MSRDEPGHFINSARRALAAKLCVEDEVLNVRFVK
jgi:hypothetical protein